MPYTVYCKQTDRQHAECYGVFESNTLADRHARRNMRGRAYVIVAMNEPLLPENYLSLERLNNAANFALTVLQNVEKARDEKYLDKCVEELKDALNDNPLPEPTKWEWEIFLVGEDAPRRSKGVDEQDAMENIGFNSTTAADWRNVCARIRRVQEAAA